MSAEKRFSVRVVKKEQISAQIIRYRLVDDNGGDLPAFDAGAHIELDIAPGMTRAYSLCSDPSCARQYYDIAVKLEPEGRGGSQTLQREAKEGSVYSISAPKNYFALEPTASHHLLIGGGIGVTPLMAMAYELHAKQQPFTLVVCTKAGAPMPFAAELVASQWPVQHFSAGRDKLDFSSLLADLPADLHAYCCGPDGLMAAVKASCNLSDAQWHQESFTPIESAVSDHNLQIYLSASDQRIEVAQGESMLDAVRGAGFEIETVCEQGICGSCLVAWRDGSPKHNDQCLDDSERQEYLALCCAQCDSATLTLEL